MQLFLGHPFSLAFATSSDKAFDEGFRCFESKWRRAKNRESYFSDAHDEFDLRHGSTGQRASESRKPVRCWTRAAWVVISSCISNKVP
jgi:hypothetical protein